ncbi:Histone acetyltransferase [Bertholletia excelsa]
MVVILDLFLSVQMLLSDASPPKEGDVLSCLSSFSDESLNLQTSDCLQFGASSVHEGFGDVLSDALVFKDEIGEFSVEGLSSSSAWRVVSKKLIDTCRQIYMRRGSLKLLCEHVNKDTPMTFDHMHKKDEDRCTSLAKFFASSSSVKIPSVIQGVVQLETLLEELLKWLDQERFGLDIEFVQEIIEQLPDVHACLEYVLLKKRSCYSSSITVGNGLLVVQTKDGRQARDDDGLVGLTRGLKRARTDMVEDLVIQCPHPPPGKPISSKIPPESIGDFLQVREFLWRFYEVLGLEDPFSIEELEEELISQTLDDCNLLGKSRELQRSLDTSLRLAGSCQRVVSSSNESDSAVIVENSQAFVEIPMRVVNEATQARLESITYGSFMGVALTKVHCSLLKVLIGELQSKVAAIMDSKCDSGESKPKRGRKKDMDVSVSTKETKLHMLPVNELTWPELARRYLLAVLSLDGNFDPQEIAIQGSGKLFRCLQGDGGLLCGSLTGVIGMEADALLLGQAMKKMFGSLSRENDMLTIDEGSSDASNACETITQSEGNIPEWAQLLEPVRKLPTNVGTRIRKCVYNALEKDPPEWAKKILEHSISKEVYKGNASGPTKKAVLSVLANVYGEGNQKKPDKERKKKNYALISDIIMKRCRVVLRRAAAADTGKVFCNMLGRNLISCGDNHDGGILGSPAMVSRPLDFRTIDLRLAVGAYGRFHEAFVDDVRELWTQIRIAHLHRPDLVHLAETLSSIFEDLYEKEVVSLYKKLVGYTKIGCLTAVSKREIDDLLASTEIPKAPWEEGVCKVCGIDKDDGSVLLCDSCDSEYHTYCLSPPLVRIPQGNWYCRFCVANKQNSQGASGCTSAIIMTGKKCHGEVTCADMENLSHLVSALEEKEYWDFSVAERISLIKFLCDELLDSSLIHQHLDHSMELSAELQHKLRSLYLEQRNLMCKDENLAANVAKTERYSSFGNCSGKTAGDNPMTEAVDAGDQFNENVHAVVEGIQLSGNVSSHISNLENNNLNLEENAQGGIKTYAGKVVSTLPFTEDGQGSCPPQEPNSFELNSTRNEASLMQESVGSMEMQLMKLSLRREFLGRDSTGRLYWVLTKLGRHSWVIVSSREMTVQKGETMTTVSGVSSPCMHRLNDVDTIDPAWLSYESDAEINELLECLTDSDPKERALKESILHWLKLQSLDSKETENRGQDESQMFDSKDKENSLLSDSLITKASSLLENKYGPWSVPETMDLTKHGRKVKVTADIKMFRCNCLEPVWPSRHHCLSCHRTFFNELEFGGHDAVCKLCLSNSKKSKGNSDFKGKEMITARRACTSELGILQESENCYDRINSNLIKYQNDGLGCPFGYDEICSKFVTDNSLKKLVQEIGLIGSNGRPSFVPSVSPYLSDSTLKLVHPKGNCGVSREESKTNEQQVLIQGINVTTDPKYMSDSSPGNAENETNARSQSDKPLSGSSSHKDENPSVHNHSPASQVGGCCVIPETALRPLLGKASQILRQLKINLLDMDAALPVGH